MQRRPTENFKAETDEEIREERRICFVGVCRAEQHLALSRTGWYFTHRQTRSRFLAEMGLLERGNTGLPMVGR